LSVQTATDANIQAILNTTENVIIKFHADWCGSCKLIAPKYRRLSDDPRFSSVAFLDCNSEDNPEIRKRASVDNLPFFATFKRGVLVKNMATAKEETIVSMIEHVMQ